MRQFTVNRFVKVCFLVAVMLAVCGATVANAAVPAVNVPTYVGIFNSNAEQMKELGGRAGRTILYMDLYQQALQAEAETAKWSAMPNGDGTYSYAQTELTGVRVSLTGNPAWSDYTVEASVYMTESLQNQDGTNGGIASLVALNSAAGYLMLDLDYGKQRLTLNRAYNRITVPLASTSYAVQLNTKYTLKIAIVDGEIKVYMNGSATPTLSAADSFLTQGV
ncbi:MAG: hypothetical protein K0Q59_3008, partial [Paenibacillus sp.]|nr:hypothetical protein [Paenibacillus sp.]